MALRKGDKGQVVGKHTPGPWSIGYDNEGNGFFDEWFTAGPAQIHFRGEEREQAEADARLIAAAPALLEALQRCKEALQAHMTRYGPTPNIVSAENIAAAALATAEGTEGG